MTWNRALAAIVVASGTAIAVLPALAQSTASSPPKRQKVDVRSMVPGPQAADAASEPRPAASGLTKDQRKEATLQARQEGTLQPAGDAAELRDARPTPPAGAPAELAATNPPHADRVATAAPPSPTKKAARKKARSAGATTSI